MSISALLAGPSVLALAVVVLRGPRPARRLARPVVRSASARNTPLVDHVRGWRRGGRAAPRTTGVWVEAWAAAVRSGRPVERALEDAFVDVPAARALLPRTLLAAGLGAEVGAAMRLDAATAGPSVRRTVLAAAACWAVARDNGGRLADALDRLGEAVRAEEVHVAHVRAQLAGPRATARLLAALPLFAIVLGTSMGLDPASVLLGEPLGRALLAGGVVLDVAGLCWTERLARAAERTA